MRRYFLVLALGFGPLATCATSFEGEAHYPGGAGQCFQDCQAQRMVMTAFVTMGEYSSGCVCSPVPAQGGQSTTGGASAAGPAVAGVVMQMRRHAETQRRQLVR